MLGRLTQVLNACAVLCCVIVTALLLRREFLPGGGAQTTVVDPARRPDVAVDNWDELKSVGHAFGPANAPVTILEFGDFECPYCATFDRGALRGVRTLYRDSLRFVYRHWPLPYHRFAYPAARAAECAEEQGRFMPFHDALFARQDSLGLLPFVLVAKESGVSDTLGFAKCISSSLPVPAVERDIKAVGKLAGVNGTPTIFINGILLGYVPDSAELDQLVRSALVKSSQLAASARSARRP